MKSQVCRRAALRLTLAVFPFIGGCETDEGESGPGFVPAALAEPVVQTVAATNTAPLAQKAGATETPGESPATPRPESSEPVAEKAAPAGELTLPPSIKPSSPLAEIVKLAQSGVEQGVMLTYITNSSHTFGLGADEIVYLNDLGLPSEVITSIMEHDKAMKQFWAEQAQTQQAAAPAPETAPAEQTAVAPSYANPPPAEPTPAEPPPANVTYNYFYDTLSPYGSWVNVDGYGMCWQPGAGVINHGWRPYCNGGRWIYTDCGWYWYSDYTWGWAPFHYGRWFSHPSYGWCWYPGYTWGPSWVSWRYTDGYCGWAPLPPAAYYSAGLGFTYYGSSVGVSFGFGLGYDCYTFVPWNRFCNYRPASYCAPRHQGRQIYHNSTVVNNVINGNNNTIINNGVPLERVTAATKGDIQKVAIRDLSGASGRNARRERLAGDGRTLAVHRPQPPHNSFATTAGRSETRQNSVGTSGRPADIREPNANGTEQVLEQRPATTRPVQKERPTPVGGRTTFAAETPAARRAASAPETRNSTETPEAPTTTATTPAPRAKPIDIPSTRSVPAPTRTWSAENSTRGSRSPERSTVPPLIVRGSDRVSEPAPARPAVPQSGAPSPRERTPPPSSLVVIGRKESSTSQRQESYTSPQPESRPARPEVSATAERQGFSRPGETQRSFSQSESSSPSVTRTAQPQNDPRPSYSAPVQRPSAPAPSFTPRPSAPSPAPQISRPAPAPAPAPAARPQPSPSAVSAPPSSPSPPTSRPQPSTPSSGSRPGSRNH